jgi:hypothetical protein
MAEDIKPRGSVALPEEYLAILAGRTCGLLLKRLDEFRIGDKCGRFKLQEWPPWMTAGNGQLKNGPKACIVMVPPL